MDLQALRYFRIVAREGSFSQAAQKLNYAQSNLSTKIRQLEGELETPLFRRHAHGVTLTEKGESLLAYADRLVHLLEEAESVVRDDGTAKEASLSARWSRRPSPLFPCFWLNITADALACH